MVRNRWLYFMLLPGCLYFVVFKYVPMWGVIIAFQNYQPFLGVAGSDWVGLRHFVRLFTEPTFFMLLKNTLMIFVWNMSFSFPFPIILALLLMYNLEMQPVRQLMSGNQAIARPGKRVPLATAALEKIEDNASIAIANPAIPLISETQVERGGELQKMIDDAKIKFIMGQLDETGWHTAIDEWLKAGGSKIIDEYTNAYAQTQ